MKSPSNNKSFNEFDLSKEILADIRALGFKEPTAIQSRCLKPILAGKDVIGLAQTGTGKTAAFGLPIVQRVADKMDISALILAPTRELAQQIGQALNEMGKSSGIRVAMLVGGVPIKEDLKKIRSWPNVIVATPGRLIDHIYSRSIDLSHVEILTIDEADRMYEMGFIPQVNQITEVLPKKRQTVMLTATMPKQVESLVRKNMQEPLRIKVGTTAPAVRAEQKLFQIKEEDKLLLLMDILSQQKGRVLVFAKTKSKVNQLARKISQQKRRVASLHGDRTQQQRETAMKGFRSGRYHILVATDIAARGIDVSDIEHVINYDFPDCVEDYIHRIGRTARATASGLATSFVTKQDLTCVKRLERMISSKLPLTKIHNSNKATTKSQPRISHPRRVSV